MVSVPALYRCPCVHCHRFCVTISSNEDSSDFPLSMMSSFVSSRFSFHAAWHPFVSFSVYSVPVQALIRTSFVCRLFMAVLVLTVSLGYFSVILFRICHVLCLRYVDCYVEEALRLLKMVIFSFLSLPLSISLLPRRSRGGRRWWRSMQRRSCLFTRQTWTLPCKSNLSTRGTAFPCFSCTTTSYEMTVSLPSSLLPHSWSGSTTKESPSLSPESSSLLLTY